ncbi:hypothetical protein NDU88_000402 [Pleurodeles waltl]|uniref:Uncharacterized protein n=1 Tax=Pleurodeles waltl TaxID=8319 RepID=A0AAV7L6D6_PLEWA|nr:hypothetical protein NDU88_000402 [Pleurodeles waltl]
MEVGVQAGWLSSAEVYLPTPVRSHRGGPRGLLQPRAGWDGSEPISGRRARRTAEPIRARQSPSVDGGLGAQRRTEPEGDPPPPQDQQTYLFPGREGKKRTRPGFDKQRQQKTLHLAQGAGNKQAGESALRQRDSVSQPLVSRTAPHSSPLKPLHAVTLGGLLQ